MNILHLSTAYTWRGGEQQIAYLMHALQTYSNVQQHLVCTAASEMEKYCLQHQLSHTAIRKVSPFNLYFAYRLKKICQAKSIDMVHLHDPHAHNLAVLSADFFKNKTPLVLSRRVDFRVRDNRFSLYKYNHPQIERILCVSDAIRHIMQPAIKDTQKLVTLHSGIDLNRFKQQSPKGILKKNYQVPDQKLLIGNVAALAPHKDYPTFIQTAALLLKKGVAAHFFIIGEGKERAMIEAYIAEKQLQEHITLTGFRNDIESILPELDIFLITSETEGLGTSILDAFACRVPVVATKAGGIVELVEHEETGLLADVKNVEALAKNVLRLVENEALKKRLVMNAFKKVQYFSTENVGRKTYEIYKTILQTNI